MATMATDKCSRCSSTTRVGLISCRHAKVCFRCCKSMVESKETCAQCGIAVTLFIEAEYPVYRYSGIEKKFFCGRFPKGDDPDFNNGQWNIGKESEVSGDPSEVSGDVVSSMEKLILEDQTGDKIRYSGRRVPDLSGKFLMLWQQDDGSFVATPAGNFYKFERAKDEVPQLTTEQAEKIMAQKDEKAGKTIKKYRKRFRTDDPKPSSTNEGDTSPEKEHWDHEEDSESDDNTVTDCSPVPKSMKEYMDEDNENFLSNAGRDVKDLLNKHKDFDKK